MYGTQQSSILVPGKCDEKPSKTRVTVTYQADKQASQCVADLLLSKNLKTYLALFRTLKTLDQPKLE